MTSTNTRSMSGQIACKLVKKNKFFSISTFTIVFDICLYARCFDSSVCLNGFSKTLKTVLSMKLVVLENW